MFVASRRRVPQTEQHLGLARGESDRVLRLDRRAISGAVAIGENGAVAPIDQGDMDRPSRRFSLLGPAKGKAAAKEVTSRQPAPRFAFAKNDGVKDRTIFMLQAEHRTAALIEGIELHPGR